MIQEPGQFAGVIDPKGFCEFLPGGVVSATVENQLLEIILPRVRIKNSAFLVIHFSTP
jgi:hypothetical protein